MWQAQPSLRVNASWVKWTPPFARHKAIISRLTTGLTHAQAFGKQDRDRLGEVTARQRKTNPLLIRLTVTI